MRIFINASVAGSVVNGFLVYCREMLRELLPLLKAAGHDVTLLLPRGSLLEEFDVDKLYLPAVCGMPKKRSPLNPICRLAYNLFVVPFLARRYDVVSSLTPHGMCWGCGRQILMLHDLIPLEFPAQHKLQYYYTRFILPWILRRSKRVICISETTRKQLLSRFHYPIGRTDVVYNGCSDEFVPISDAADRIAAKYGVRDYLLACGVGFPHKNIRFLIENYVRLPEALQEKHPILLVGNNADPYAQSLMHLAQDMNCGARIHFAGMVPQADLPALYSAARLLVYPTLCEGFGMPPIEAARCGTPSLISKLPVLREVTGLPDLACFDPHDSADLLRKLEVELQHPKAMRPEFFARAAEFSWQRAAEQILKILEEVGT